MCLAVVNLIGMISILILIVVLIDKDNISHFSFGKLFNKDKAKFSPTYYQYQYTKCFSPPRPNHNEDCLGYNEWVGKANECGNNVLNDCRKIYNENECPTDLPWLKSRCF